VKNPELTDRIIRQGQALVRAIESLDTIEPTGPGPIERAIVWLLLQAYRRRLRAIVELAPPWVGEEILRASVHIDDRRPAVWPSKN
jgi:hypothetical protein